MRGGGGVIGEGSGSKACPWLSPRAQVALVAQEPVLFGCSIKKNILYGPGAPAGRRPDPDPPFAESVIRTQSHALGTFSRSERGIWTDLSLSQARKDLDENLF